MNNLIELPLATLAGVLTIASPCVLPILPIVLGSTLQGTNRGRPLFIVAGSASIASMRVAAVTSPQPAEHAA